MINLEVSFEKQKHENMQISHKLSKLEEDNKLYHNEKIKFIEHKTDLENCNERLKFDYEMLSSSKDLALFQQV